MHAHRYAPAPDALDEAQPIDASRPPENDNGTASPDFDGDPATLASGVIVARGPSRRAWLIAGVIAASISASAYAWTRPPSVQPSTAPSATPVDIAALAIPVPQGPTTEPPPLVIPNERPTRARGRTPHAPASAHTPTAETTRDGAQHALPSSAHDGSSAPLARVVAPEAPAQPMTDRGASERAAPEGQESTEEPEAPIPTDSADEVVERAVAEHADAIERCINDADDSASGRVMVHLVIARDGGVRSATPSAPEALRPVGQCLAREMRGWRLVVPDATGETSISWPFEVESNAN